MEEKLTDLILSNIEKGNYGFIIVIIFAAYKLIKNKNTNNEEVLYPAINDELISELEEGKKTYLFDSESLLACLL